jgi:hydrogenase nickel incorporation protein HypA/HybF
VVPEMLRSAFALLAEDSALAGASLDLELVPAGGTCERCGATSSWESFPFACARCGSRDVVVTTGEELVVSELELSEPAPTAAGWDP